MSASDDQARFVSCRESGKMFARFFHECGRKTTAELAKGNIESAAGALIAMEGEAAAYHFVSGIADSIALRMIDAGKGEL